MSPSLFGRPNERLLLFVSRSKPIEYRSGFIDGTVQCCQCRFYAFPRVLQKPPLHCCCCWIILVRWMKRSTRAVMRRRRTDGTLHLSPGVHVSRWLLREKSSRHAVTHQSRVGVEYGFMTIETIWWTHHVWTHHVRQTGERWGKLLWDRLFLKLLTFKPMLCLIDLLENV